MANKNMRIANKNSKSANKSLKPEKKTNPGKIQRQKFKTTGEPVVFTNLSLVG